MNEALVRPLTIFIQNGTLFFTKAKESLNTVKNSEELLKYYKGISSIGSSSNRKKTLNDIMTGEQGFSVSAYKDLVSVIIKDMTSMISMLTGMGGKVN